MKYNTANEVGLLRAPEVARMLGLSVYRVYGLAKEGDLESIKFQRSVRFEREVIERFIRDHRRSPEKV